MSDISEEEWTKMMAEIMPITAGPRPSGEVVWPLDMLKALQLSQGLHRLLEKACIRMLCAWDAAQGQMHHETKYAKLQGLMEKVRELVE